MTMMMMMLTMKMKMMMTRIRNSVLVRVGGPWWKLSGKVGGVTKVWFTLYSVAGSSTLSGVVCNNGLHSDTMPVLPSDTGHTVLKLKGDPLQCFLVKLMQLFLLVQINLKRLFFPFFLGVLFLLSCFLDSHFPEFRRQFFAFSWFLSPTSTEQSRHLKSQLSHLFSSFLLRVVQIQTSAVNNPSKGLPPPTRPDYPN